MSSQLKFKKRLFSAELTNHPATTASRVSTHRHTPHDKTIDELRVVLGSLPSTALLTCESVSHALSSAAADDALWQPLCEQYVLVGNNPWRHGIDIPRVLPQRQWLAHSQPAPTAACRHRYERRSSRCYSAYAFSRGVRTGCD